MPSRIAPDKCTIFASFDSLINANDLPTGRFTVMHNDLPVDFHYENLGSDKTMVLFHAALSAKVSSIPVFLGRNLVRDIRVNRLFVSDPTLAINPNLRLAWYVGSSVQPDLQLMLTAVFRHFARGVKQMIFFGASGGGFASLFYSSQVRDSIAVPVNPQTDISKYNPQAVESYVSIGWGSTPDPTNSIDIVPAITNLVEHYINPFENRVIYVQNDQDESHVANHWMPFKDVCSDPNRFDYVIGSFGQGHVAPTREYLTDLLTSVVQDN